MNSRDGDSGSAAWDHVMEAPSGAFVMSGLACST